MNASIRRNNRGMSLIELMVGLVICAVVVAGIYRLFTAQSKAYNVQDQVAEVQQSIRSAMEIILRDLRMAGFDDDRTPLVTLPQPPVVVGDHAITIRYEHNNALCEVRYWLEGGSTLNRQETQGGVTKTEAILENVEGFTLVYGVDEDDDGAMDDRNGNGHLDDWVDAATVGGLKVVSARATLTARPVQLNPDLQSVTPRTLVSAVTFRNLSLLR